MHAMTEQWFAERTFQYPDWTVESLVAAKAGRRVAVVLPALDEEATVGAIVAAILPLTCGDAPLVDELVVVDSGSTDRTIEVAAAAGARVVRRADVVPELPPLPGKGEVLWRSLAATTGDVTKAGKAIGLALGVGLGAAGAGVGIGIIFGKVIESVTRQPEMRDEITSIRWLGFALTEACFFYGLVAGLIAFFL